MEIFDIIIAVNRLKEKVGELGNKIDFLAKSPNLTESTKYVDEAAACKMLRVKPRTIAKMRSEGTLPFIRIRRHIIYLASDLTEYLDKNCKR
jgi:excisionase family DNA binding protein